MRSFTLVTDSSCDLPIDILEEYDIKCLPLHLNFGEEQYLDEKDEKGITFKEVYARIRSGEMASTSAVSLGLFEELFENEAKAGRDVLYLAFSSGLSTTYQSGVIAANSVKEKYPSAKILVVDTLAASLGQGLLVYLCAEKAKSGASAEEVRDYAEQMKLHICHFFTVEDLVYLKRGGRISAATALVGGLLNIKPYMHMDDAGHLVSIGKAKGRKASLLMLAESIKDNELPETKKIAFICHADCIEDAEFLQSVLKERYGFEKVVIGYTGPVIGSHSGPGTVALFYVGGKR